MSRDTSCLHLRFKTYARVQLKKFFDIRMEKIQGVI